MTSGIAALVSFFNYFLLEHLLNNPLVYSILAMQWNFFLFLLFCKNKTKFCLFLQFTNFPVFLLTISSFS